MEAAPPSMANGHSFSAGSINIKIDKYQNGLQDSGSSIRNLNKIIEVTINYKIVMNANVQVVIRLLIIKVSLV